ncbi:hypothetical protein AB205_0043160, partial [Aquarana catesbeiana]
MSEGWPHAQVPPPSMQPTQQQAPQQPITLGEHAIPPPGSAENPLGCAVYGILLQPDLGVQHPPLPPSEPKCGLCGHDLSHLGNPQEHQCLTPANQDRSFQCTQCLKIFHQATDLLEHQCNQVEQKPFVCGVCKMGFSLLTSLAQHHNAHNGSALKCSICEKTYKSPDADRLRFKESSQLLQHPCTPAGERPFRCSACQKTFRRPSDLRQHERTHSEERPFHCDLCQMSFKQQYALMRHRRTHKTDDPNCTLCEKVYTQHGAESIFKCNACQRGFSQSQELLRHKCGQSGSERPFQCSVCHKTYKRSSALQKHQAAHCSEKPLRCT